MVKRVVALPLIRATCTAVSGAYNAAKDKHPLLGSACRLAEHCVCSVTTCALDHAQPLLEHLQPQCESEESCPPVPTVISLYQPRTRCPSMYTTSSPPFFIFLTQSFALWPRLA